MIVKEAPNSLAKMGRNGVDKEEQHIDTNEADQSTKKILLSLIQSHENENKYSVVEKNLSIYLLLRRLVEMLSKCNITQLGYYT